MADTNVDIKVVEKLAKVLNDAELTEIEYETENVSIRLLKETNTVQVAQAPVAIQPALTAATAPVAQAPAATTATTDTADDYENHPGVLKSPMVGVVYLAPEPGARTYVKEGENITVDQTLLLIEAMKTFNPVLAPKGGKVVKILVEDGMPVEFDEPLLIIE